MCRYGVQSGREFTLATNQVDFAQPERFDLRYVNAEGKEETPLCIHRAPLEYPRAHDRLLIEHYAGAFPTWLAPQQVAVVPITDAHNEYAVKLANELTALGVRTQADLSAERMNAKIRNAQLMKVPYMLVVGDQEVQDGTVALRKRDGSRQNGLPFGEFKQLIQDRIATRSAEL